MARKRVLSRREVLKLIGLGGTGVLAAACAPKTTQAPLPTPTPLPKPETPKAADTPTPSPTPKAGGLVNAFGVTLPEDAAPPEQQYLRVMATDNETLDFAVAVYSRPDPPWQTLSTPLVQLNKNFELEPGAALSWEVADDQLTWTFHLDPKLTWSDGVPVTAQDYEWTFQYMADPKHGYDFAWYWGFSCNPKNWGKVVKGEVPLSELGVKATDDHTLQVVTERPAPYTPATMIFSRPMAKHQVEKHGVYYNNDPKTSVSSEPWILEEWTKGKRIVLGPNLKYTGRRKPFIERWIFIIGDKNTEFDAYMADELDWATSNFSPGDLDFIMSDPELQKQYHPGFGDFRTHYLFFDTYHPPFDNLKVRQAFAHAIDRKALVDNIIKILGRPAYGMLMPGFPDAVEPDELKKYQVHDPELARSLLSDAGYADGKGFPKLTLWLRQERELGQAIGNAVASMIKETLGIEVEVTNKESKIFMEKMNAHEITFGMVSYGMDYFDASNLLGIWKSGGRHAWTNEKFDKLVTEASALMGNPEKRHQMFVEAQHILSEDVGGAFLWHVTPGDMWKPYVKGEQLEPDRWGVAACHWPCMESIGVTSYTVYVSQEVSKYPRGKK